MDRIIKKKKPKYPDWLIYSLKGLLLVLLCWNLNKQISKSFFNIVDKPKKAHKIIATPYIEEISFNHLLSTTRPKIDHYMQWGNKKIPFVDPEILEDKSIQYQTFTRNEFEKFWTEDFSLHYKGHLLHPNKVNAIFIDEDGTSTACEDEGDFTTCFYSNLRHFRDNFALWMSIETEEGKTFFSKIRITQKPDLQLIVQEDYLKKWKKFINRDKHKSIDNLTVVKPVFQTHDYLFRWGDWERYAHGPRGGRRVKLGINDFQQWVNHQPALFKNGKFISFSMSINYWNRNKWGENCFINRRTKKAPLIASNDCFKNMVETIKVGDVLSIYIFIEGEFIKTLSRNSLSALPGFMYNDQYIRFSIPIEIVEESFQPNNGPLKLTTSTFSFQLNSSLGKNAIVKMDTENPKNKSLLKHYSESETAEIIHISHFKTIRRVITEDDVFVKREQIEKIYTLPNKVFKIETFPEFYDFNIQPPLIKLRGLSTVLDKTVYDLSDFKKSSAGFEMYIGDEKVKLLQITFTVVPKKGKAIQYITNNFSRNDMVRRLRKIKKESSLYFENVLFERSNGEQMVFPLTTALHLK